MPRLGQIIPEYSQPYVSTYINDNTEVQDITTPTPNGIKIISVFTSGEGRDGVLLSKDNVTDYLSEYGNPNYKLYGQPGYMPYAALSSNQAKAWCMRVMPDDASYANMVIVAKIKVDKTIPASPKLVVRHKAVFLTGLLNKDEFETQVDLLCDEDPDTDGFSTYPIIGVYCLGRGAYGKLFRTRLSAAPQADKDNIYKNYVFEVLTSKGGVKRLEVFSGTLFPDAVDGNNSLYLEDLINDPEGGSEKIGAYVSQPSLTKVYNLFKAQISPGTTLIPETFDILTALDKTGKPISSIQIDTTTAGTIAIDNVAGNVLDGGTDGSFATTVAADVRNDAITAAYIKAFNGEYDKSILSKRRAPAQLIFDANYDSDVKRALIGLMITRYDAFGYIDGGILQTQSDAIAWAETMVGIGDRVFSKECNHYKIRDPFSGKSIPVTITYFLAQQLPLHFTNVGNEVPFVGQEVATLSGYIKNTLKPAIDADDLEVKEQLCNAQVNYFQCISENTFVRGTQTTSQSITSDLSEENNVHVMLEMKRKLEILVDSLLFNFSDAADRQRFTETAKRLFSDYEGTKVGTVDVYFDMNEWENERQILHCYLAVTYKTLAKRGIIEIDINKRN